MRDLTEVLEGTNRSGNLVLACTPCNRRKGASIW